MSEPYQPVAPESWMNDPHARHSVLRRYEPNIPALLHRIDRGDLDRMVDDAEAYQSPLEAAQSRGDVVERIAASALAAHGAADVDDAGDEIGVMTRPDRFEME